MLPKIGKNPSRNSDVDRKEEDTGTEDTGTLETELHAEIVSGIEEQPDSSEFPGESSVASPLASNDFGTNIKISLERSWEAQTLRERSQSVFAQSESITEEAIRSVEAAGKAYGEGFEAKSAANIEATARARAMAETLKSRMRNTRSAFQAALEQAIRTKGLSEKNLATALDSLDFEVVNVEQELAESAKAFAIADSAKEQAIQDLLAVHSMWTGLAPHREHHGPSYTTTDDMSADSPAESGGADVASGSSHELPTTAGESAAETLQRELAGFVNTSARSKPGATLQPVGYGVEPERTYSGRLYLIFDASLTKEALESVWDAVDMAAGSGSIVDTRLLSQAEGVQMTLNLNETTLDVSMFLRRLRGAEATAISGDRLKVSWSGFA